VIDEYFSLSANQFSCLKEVPIFNMDDKSALHPIDYFAVHGTKEIAIIISGPKIELWPAAFKITSSVYVESRKAGIYGIHVRQEEALTIPYIKRDKHGSISHLFL